MNVVAVVATRINRGLPWLKRLVPRSAKRLVLLHLVGSGRHYKAPPSREWLETQVLPQLPDLGFHRILFVGAGPYTWHYERVVRKAGGIWTTVDHNPSASVWGGRRHIQARVQDIGRYCAEGAVDAVILNGVFGFGLNTIAEMNDAVQAVRKILRPGGLLLLGWNTDLTPDPLDLEQMRDGFVDPSELPFPARLRFKGETHVYDFARRSSGNVTTANPSSLRRWDRGLSNDDRLE